MKVVDDAEAVEVVDREGRRRTIDNIHQSSDDVVDEPFINPGCPECVHMHWRWAEYLRAGTTLGNLVVSPRFNNNLGKPLIPFGSDQDIEIAVVRSNAGEEDTADFRQLISSPAESLLPESNANPVFWYAGTGKRAFDQFLTHGGFFSGQGSLPAISRLKASLNPARAGVDNPEITFSVSNVLAHPVNWTATLITVAVAV